MDIRLLRYFLTIAEEGNVTKAAERLHMSQPPLSKQMKQLEEDLGVCLFTRGKKNIQLTEAGVFLKNRAEELIASFELTERQLVEFQGGRKGHIQVGAVESFVANRMPALIKGFHEVHENITFWIYSTVNADDILEKLDKNIIDIAFVRHPFDDEKYDYMEVMSDCWGVLIPWDHPLADPDITRVTAEMLKDVVINTTTAKNRAVEKWLRAQGVEPDILCWWDSVVAGEALAESGIGVSIVLMSYVHGSCGRRTVYKKLYPEVESSIYAVWSKKRTMADSTLRFLDYLKGQDVVEI